MKVFYNKKTGDIIGTVDGFDEDLIKGVKIQPSGIPSGQIVEEVIGLGHPKEALARRLLEPRDELGIQFLKIGSGGIEEMTEPEKTAVRKKQKPRAPRPSSSQPLQAQIDALKQDIKQLKQGS